MASTMCWMLSFNLSSIPNVDMFLSKIIFYVDEYCYKLGGPVSTSRSVYVRFLECYTTEFIRTIFRKQTKFYSLPCPSMTDIKLDTTATVHGIILESISNSSYCYYKNNNPINVLTNRERKRKAEVLDNSSSLEKDNYILRFRLATPISSDLFDTNSSSMEVFRRFIDYVKQYPL